MAKYPDVTVQLSSDDGNVYAVIGAVERALKRAGYREDAIKFRAAAFEAESYEDVISLAEETVQVT
ncbi:hypothetical protein [Streptomyces sp. 5-10]|uniref:hypothetical protein n=1 Tax=Streptomyces sp. 5-10 TaxID=878925 RepID=UPI00168A6DE4|nr:hypothetical protein [Streptomyces sp. 5-10]MBD3004618.1 hypothetical protein [Streptomyces sp. 5-10]